MGLHLGLQYIVRRISIRDAEILSVGKIAEFMLRRGPPSMIIIFFISDIFPLVVDVVYQILLVTNFEIDPFAIACQIEYVFVLGLGVLEVS